MDTTKRRIAHLLPTPAPAPGAYDYSLDLMDKLLGHAGLRLADGLVVRWTTPEEVAATLTTYQPHLILLWEQHGHMLRALSGQRRGIDDMAGYLWLATAVVPGVKCLATYAPARITKDWGLTGVVKWHLAKAAREARTDELVVPTRRIVVCMPSY